MVATLTNKEERKLKEICRACAKIHISVNNKRKKNRNGPNGLQT